MYAENNSSNWVMYSIYENATAHCTNNVVSGESWSPERTNVKMQSANNAIQQYLQQSQWFLGMIH